MYIKQMLRFACFSLLASSSLHAMSLKDSVEKVMATNPEIIAEKNNQEAFRKYIDERRANYYPRIDIDGKLEASNTKKRYDLDNNNSGNGLNDGSDQEDGYNVGISLNQILYDGNLTPSQIKEAKYNNIANKFRTNQNIDNVILETVSAYTGLIQYNESLNLTKSMIQTNEENLQIAKEKESISGEVLETYQVESKLSFVREKYLEEKDLKSSRTSTFRRYVSAEPDGNECRPNMDLTKIPASLQETVELAVLRNYEILEQIERVKAQREKIAQADAKFLPNLGLELKALTDNDLSLDENGIENQAYGRLNLSWNLFNGGGDYAVSKQEELFLAEQKERLDAITNKIVEEVKVTHQRFSKNKDRIEVLKKYVEANENIVQVYKSEFEAGTRTFVDILDAETVLYEAKKSLLNREYELYSNYYSLLNSLSMLSTTVLSSDAQSCSGELPSTGIPELSSLASNNETVTSTTSDELNALLGDDAAVTPAPIKEINQETGNTLEPIILPADSISNSEYTSFLQAPSAYYTINITTTKGLEKANEYINENNLSSQNAYAYAFGPEMKSAKVLYGIFSSVKEAKSAMDAMPSSVIATKPYIDNVSKHQKLYAKYH